MLYKAVKDSCLKFCSPQIFSNCDQNWFEFTSAYYLCLLLHTSEKLITHHHEKFQINWPDKPTPLDHLNYFIKNTVNDYQSRYGVRSNETPTISYLFNFFVNLLTLSSRKLCNFYRKSSWVINYVSKVWRRLVWRDKTDKKLDVKTTFFWNLCTTWTRQTQT